MIEAVVFDLDGVLLQTEEVWNAAKEDLTRERGGEWHERAPFDMMGMSSLEWSAYMRDRLGVDDDPGRISAEVVSRLEAIYREQLPLIDGAQEAVRRLADRWPLALASSSNRELIDLALDLSELAPCFQATVSSEEVPRGRPAPEVYLEGARRLGVAPTRCAAVEDSTNGIRSAKAAGMRVLALPNPAYPPEDDALAEADVVLRSLADLTPRLVESDR